MKTCSDPDCRDGWIWVDIDDLVDIKQRCPSCSPPAMVEVPFDVDPVALKAAWDERGIPRYALLDVWVALGGQSTDFEEWMDDPARTLADAWSQLLAAVAGRLTALFADTNPPAGDALLALVAARVRPESETPE